MKPDLLIENKKDCIGCGSCICSCATNAIKMVKKEGGFLYPEIDKSLCVDCGDCVNNCPMFRSKKSGKEREVSYACQTRDMESLHFSTSGGFFGELASYVLSKNGVVYGAAFNDKFLAEHIRVDSINNLWRLKKSKYVQSDLKDTYKYVKQDLKTDKIVLFSGTPCQVQGLYSFLQMEEIDNLIAIELFCGSVNSPGIWHEYVKDHEKGNNKKAVSCDFRYKVKKEEIVNEGTGLTKYGWKAPALRIEFEDGSYYMCDFEKDPFLDGFKTGLMGRRCCYDCTYRFDEDFSGADFSIGDFWGVENYDIDIDYVNGISAVVLNTEKSQTIFESIKEKMNYKKVDINNIIQANKPAFYKKFNRVLTPNREKLFNEFEAGNYADISTLIANNLPSLLNRRETINFGIWGSFNTRFVINQLIIASNHYFLYQFSNSTIESVVSKPAKLEFEKYPSNPFRKEMLEADICKSFWTSFDKNIDIMILDLLEERFNTLNYNRTKITESDAFNESKLKEEDKDCITVCQKEDSYQNYIAEYIKRIKHSDIKHIIVVELYLSEVYGDEINKKEFNNIQEIRIINNHLQQYYDFIKTKYPEYPHVILEKEHFWCEKTHRHGIQPCHMNTNAYNILKERIADAVNLLMG